MLLDDYAQGHLERWLTATIGEADDPDRQEERQRVKARMLAYIEENPDVLETHGWPEIRHNSEVRFS